MDVKRKKFGFTPLETKVSNRGSNRFLTGFTLAEILTVLGIIALLVGLLVPTLSWVRNTAREVKQKAQLTTIALALEAFKNDYGDYPNSDSLSDPDYSGAQILCEALLGWDLLGFHPDSVWDAAGTAYGLPPSIANLQQRKGPYLELATVNAFRLGNISVAKPGLFDAPAPAPLAPDTFVICDSFGVKQVRVVGKTVKAGTPILYYRANTSSKTIIPSTPPAPPAPPEARIYNVLDNYDLIALGRVTDSKLHPLGELDTFPLNWEAEYARFYKYIRDMKVTAASLIIWPYRPDSYILISAGADGLYGTSDDITNFGN